MDKTYISYAADMMPAACTMHSMPSPRLQSSQKVCAHPGPPPSLLKSKPGVR